MDCEPEGFRLRAATANAWEQGEVIQLQRVQGSGEHGRGDTAHFGTSEQSRQ